MNYLLILRSRVVAFGVLLPGLVVSACAVPKAYRPCSEGGDPAREKAIRGTKRCSQVKDKSNQWVNEGPYVEYFPNGQKAAEGEYKMGRKHGRWFEWNEDGKKTSDKHYDNGKEVPDPRDQTNVKIVK